MNTLPPCAKCGVHGSVIPADATPDCVRCRVVVGQQLQSAQQQQQQNTTFAQQPAATFAAAAVAGPWAAQPTYAVQCCPYINRQGKLCNRPAMPWYANSTAGCTKKHHESLLKKAQKATKAAAAVARTPRIEARRNTVSAVSEFPGVPPKDCWHCVRCKRQNHSKFRFCMDYDCEGERPLALATPVKTHARGTHPPVDVGRLDPASPKLTAGVDATVQPLTPYVGDPSLLPRCEFHHRYAGTTVFVMDEPRWWNTYFRSDSARTSGSLQFTTTSISRTSPHNKTLNVQAPNAHFGGYRSPLAERTRTSPVMPGNMTPGAVEILAGSLRDEVLRFKLEACSLVKSVFDALCGDNARSPPPSGNSNQHSDVVSVQNDYPCIIVRLRIFSTEWAKTKCPAWLVKDALLGLQQLAICLFVAQTNALAEAMCVPVEMVVRAGFGHSGPSVSATGSTFRVSMGLAPPAYCFVVAKALQYLCQAIECFSAEYSPVVRIEDVQKLLNKDGQSSHAGTVLAKLGFAPAVVNTRAAAAAASGVAVTVSLFDVLLSKANSQHTILYEMLLRAPVNAELAIDLLIDQLDAIVAGESAALTPGRVFAVLRMMLCELSIAPLKSESEEGYSHGLVTHNFTQARLNAPRHWSMRVFSGPSDEWDKYWLGRQRPWQDSTRWLQLIDDVCSSLSFEPLSRCETNPQQRMFAFSRHLEKANLHFINRHAHAVDVESDYGSASDTDEYFEAAGAAAPVPATPAAPSLRVYRRKLRVQTGMQALCLAYRLAVDHVLSLGVPITQLAACTDYMYFEAPDAFRLVDVMSHPGVPTVTVQKPCTPHPERRLVFGNDLAGAETTLILAYDLNHWNKVAHQNGARTLSDVLGVAGQRGWTVPTVILDATSSMSERMSEGVLVALSNGRALTFVVTSGLKHDQAGADFSPYGELRVFATSRQLAVRTYRLAHTLLDAATTPVGNPSTPPGLTHRLVREYRLAGHTLDTVRAFTVPGIRRTQSVVEATPERAKTEAAVRPVSPTSVTELDAPRPTVIRFPVGDIEEEAQAMAAQQQRIEK